MNRVMVYGTLKRGNGNHSLLEKSDYLGPAVTEEAKYTMVDYGFFPAVIPSGEMVIHGEAYDVSDGVLARLDRLEGHPNFYTRTRVKTNFGEAWMYLIKPETLKDAKYPVIEGGIWRGKSQR